MKVASELEMLNFGKKVATRLTLPTVIELVGDVGVGKTTFTRGLAEGLGVLESVTSPSFTISKRYPFSIDSESGELIHYDFYRLDSPGIMYDELAETLREPRSVVVVEWGGNVTDLLPEEHLRFDIQLNPDGSREIITNQPELLESLE